jgi:hypothetical protein
VTKPRHKFLGAYAAFARVLEAVPVRKAVALAADIKLVGDVLRASRMKPELRAAPACVCGHVREEHDEAGSNPEYPGSTACTIDACDCCAFEEA